MLPLALLALFTLGGAFAGAACAALLERHRRWASHEDAPSRALSVAASSVLFAFGAWVSVSWLLALTHTLTRGGLALAGALELALGIATLVRLRPFRGTRERVMDGWFVSTCLAALVPVFLWVVFVFWRGTVLPVYNHDALAYHLPKAVLLMRAHGFGVFAIPEARAATWPCDYELLLADTMILTGDDHFTAAIATVAYLAILLVSAKLAARWWGGGAHVAVVAAVVAAVPILVLHSGLHKNDVLEAFFAVVVFAGAARWLALGCVASLVEASVALLLSVGTKVNGFIFVVAAAPLFLAGLYRHRASVSAPRFLSFALASFTASMFTGSACYVANLVATHRFVERPDMTGGAGYGDWSNLWQYTAMVILHPFEAREAVVWNPFDRRYFWWPTNDVWMSHFGLVVTLLALAAVPCAVRYRARAPSSSLERIAASLAALAAYALTLPIHMHPRGFFAMYGRYVVFVAPFVVAWTASPLILEIAERGRRWRRGIELAVGAACGVGFVRSADTFGVHDAYAPIAWVEHLLHHPEDRIPFVRRNRAASVFDRNVGPDVSVAMDVGYDTWIYPAYGEHWTRDVRFLAPGGGGHVSVPDDVDWVLVDRSWNYFFGNPDFVDMSRIDLLGKGMPTAEDLAVYRQLEADPRFSLVYEDRPQLQAIFHRNGRD